MRHLLRLLPLVAVLAGAPVMAASDRPVDLTIHADGDSVEFAVIAASVDTPVTFTLAVESTGTGGTTRTTQGGSAKAGDAGRTVLRSRIATSALKGWKATLHVTGDGIDYVEERAG